MSERDPALRGNVVAKNASGLTALDYTTVTNNWKIGVFLAEIFFLLGRDITCRDAAGNTIVRDSSFQSRNCAFATVFILVWLKLFNLN